MAVSGATGMVDTRIFEDLQTKIDEDAEVRDQIRAILQTLERQGRTTQSILSRAHSTPAAHRECQRHDQNRILLMSPSQASHRCCGGRHQTRHRERQQAFCCSLNSTILQVRGQSCHGELPNKDRQIQWHLDSRCSECHLQCSFLWMARRHGNGRQACRSWQAAHDRRSWRDTWRYDTPVPFLFFMPQLI
jgi:hypothetical protein